MIIMMPYWKTLRSALVEKLRCVYHSILSSILEVHFARIDALHYDVKRQSTQHILHFYLQLDWKGFLNIRCAKFSVSHIEL